MKILRFPQRSQEWFDARLGIPTASAFDRILTPKTLKPSSQAEAYAEALLSEWVLGEPAVSDYASGATDRGSDLEDDARRAYAFERGVDVEQVGLCLTNDGAAGCSPDGLVGEDGGVEIKIPLAKQHVHYLLKPEDLVADYRLQVQGALFVTGRAWWDLISYSPAMPPVIQRVEPDDAVDFALHSALTAGGWFLAMLEAGRERLMRHGCVSGLERRRAEAAKKAAAAAEWDVSVWETKEPVRVDAEPEEFSGPVPF